MLARLRTSFLTGVVVIAPVALTIWLIWSVIGWIDGFVLPFVPDAYRPEKILGTLFGYDLQLNIRGVGVVVFLIFATFVGWMAIQPTNVAKIRNTTTPTPLMLSCKS